jgi:predicted transcriptional regulator
MGVAKLLDTIRKAIRTSGEMPAAIAARAGLPKSALSRLLAGKTMTVDGIEKLARALRLTIKVEPERGRKGR